MGAERVVRDLDGVDAPRFSPEGRRIALASIEQGHYDVRVYDLHNGTLARLSFSGTNVNPEWTPDGRRVVFASTGANLHAHTLHWTQADGSGEAAPLLPAILPQFEVAWAPDGRSLVFRQNDPTTSMDLMVLPLDSPRTPRPYLKSRFSELMPAMSPDGRWLPYVSNESGRNEVYVRAFPVPAGVWQVSSGGGVEPRWARSGREIYYRSGDSLVSAAVSTRPTFTVGARQTLFVRPYEFGANYAGYDVHPDNRRFVMVKSGAERSGLIVALNFFEELRRRAAGPR